MLMERFDFEGMLRAVEKYPVSYMPVSSPLVIPNEKTRSITKRREKVVEYFMLRRKREQQQFSLTTK
jgi:hypothetical protein